MPKASTGKYLLHWGLHDGTTVGRDTGNPVEYDSEKAVRTKWDEIKAGLGHYRVWFAFMYDDQGKQTELAPAQPYER